MVKSAWALLPKVGKFWWVLFWKIMIYIFKKISSLILYVFKPIYTLPKYLLGFNTLIKKKIKKNNSWLALPFPKSPQKFIKRILGCWRDLHPFRGKDKFTWAIHVLHHEHGLWYKCWRTCLWSCMVNFRFEVLDLVVFYFDVKKSPLYWLSFDHS